MKRVRLPPPGNALKLSSHHLGNVPYTCAVFQFGGKISSLLKIPSPHFFSLKKRLDNSSYIVYAQVSNLQPYSVILVTQMKPRSCPCFDFWNQCSFFYLCDLKAHYGGRDAGEMTQRLRALAALAEEDLGSVFSTHIRQLTTTCDCRSRAPDTLFWPTLTSALTCPHTYAYHPHIINKRKILRINTGCHTAPKSYCWPFIPGRGKRLCVLSNSQCVFSASPVQR